MGYHTEARQSQNKHEDDEDDRRSWTNVKRPYRPSIEELQYTKGGTSWHDDTLCIASTIEAKPSTSMPIDNEVFSSKYFRSTWYIEWLCTHISAIFFNDESWDVMYNYIAQAQAAENNTTLKYCFITRFRILTCTLNRLKYFEDLKYLVLE